MIRRLNLNDVGPARELTFPFAPRLNVLTGDNGLGKTFVLDVVWWVLTTTWAGEKAFPRQPPVAAPFEFTDYDSVPELKPRIQALLTKREGQPSVGLEVVTGGTWKWESQEWVRSQWTPQRRAAGFSVYPEQHDEADFRPQSLVIYARVDGSYAVFDSHYVKGGISTFAEAAIVLSSSELWDGKEVTDSEVQGGKSTVIAGLISDWVSWQQRADSPEFYALRKVLHALASPGEPLVPGEPTRVHLRDRRDIPTLATSYGVVPVTLASAGMKRALSLAYLLVWAWTEHLKAAKQRRRKPTQDVVLIIDEPELHQHPAWQRAFLPAVLKAVGMVAPNAAVQVFTATHSPLVLASLESQFDPQHDALFAFDVMPRAGRVKVEKVRWRPRGDVSNWLTSDVFDLEYARSREAEEALKKAVRALDQPGLPDEEARRIHHELHESLGDTDPFWARWISYAQARGLEP